MEFISSLSLSRRVVLLGFLLLRWNTMTKGNLGREGFVSLMLPYNSWSIIESRLAATQAGKGAGGRSWCRGRSAAVGFFLMACSVGQFLKTENKLSYKMYFIHGFSSQTTPTSCPLLPHTSNSTPFFSLSLENRPINHQYKTKQDKKEKAWEAYTHTP